MITMLEVLLLGLGFASGFMSGLLGIGGAIVLIPLLMYVPPLFGIVFSFHHITGLSMAQVFFASLTGAITYLSGGNMRLNLVIIVGGMMMLTSFAGSVLSANLSENTLTIIFAMVLFLSMMMLLKVPKEKKQDKSIGEEQAVEAEQQYMQTTGEKFIGAAIGGVVGILSGIVGVGGAAFVTSSLSYILKIPIKICIGTSLGIILVGGAAGFIGKAITGQVPLIPAIFLVIGAIIGARLGSKVGMKLSGDLLRKLLIFVLFIILLQLFLSII